MTDMMLTGRVFDANEGQTYAISNYRVAGRRGFGQGAGTGRARSPATRRCRNYAITQALPRIADLSAQRRLVRRVADFQSIAQGDEAGQAAGACVPREAVPAKVAEAISTEAAKGLSTTASTTSSCSTACARRMVDYMGAFADANPIDLGIKAARELFKAQRHCCRREVDSMSSPATWRPAASTSSMWRATSGCTAGVPVERAGAERAAHLRHRLRDLPPGRRADHHAGRCHAWRCWWAPRA